VSWLLGGTSIRKANGINEGNSTQVAQNRTLGGNVNRDYFGNNKNIFTLSYQDVNYTDWATINTIYQAFLTDKTARGFQITDTNYNGAASTSRNCHVDLLTRDFKKAGNSFLSDFTLILTEQ
jgi:hypothetical protein